jgi:hypothetical protein
VGARRYEVVVEVEADLAQRLGARRLAQLRALLEELNRLTADA